MKETFRALGKQALTALVVAASIGIEFGVSIPLTMLYNWATMLPPVNSEWFSLISGCIAVVVVVFSLVLLGITAAILFIGAVCAIDAIWGRRKKKVSW